MCHGNLKICNGLHGYSLPVTTFPLYQVFGGQIWPVQGTQRWAVLQINRHRGHEFGQHSTADMVAALWDLTLEKDPAATIVDHALALKGPVVETHYFAICHV